MRLSFPGHKNVAAEFTLRVEKFQKSDTIEIKDTRRSNLLQVKEFCQRRPRVLGD